MERQELEERKESERKLQTLKMRWERMGRRRG